MMLRGQLAWALLLLIASVATVTRTEASAAPSVPHVALSPCLVGNASLTYLLGTGPSGATADGGSLPFTPLLLFNQIQPGFAPGDPTTGAAYSVVPSFIGGSETTSSFRIDWASADASEQGAECAGEDQSRVQWLLTVDLEDPATESGILSSIEISTTQNDASGAASDPPVLPTLSFSPATSAALVTPVSNAWSEFNLTYSCAQGGNVGVLLRLTLFVPDPSTGALVHSTSHSMKFSKLCAAESCDGLCGTHGVCNAVTARCDCDPGYTWDPYCSYGIWVDQTSVCADEEFTFHWDVASVRDAEPQAISDWLGLFGPPLTCIGCAWTPELVMSEYYLGYMPEWFYFVSMASTYSTGPPVTVGSATFTMREDLPGTWALAFYLSDSTDQIMAIISVEQLPRNHSRCLARAETRRAELVAETIALQTAIQSRSASLAPFWPPPSGSEASGSLLLDSAPLVASDVAARMPCISGTLNEFGGACDCPPGRWGPLCEQGCSSGSPVLLDAWFGGEFGSSPPGLPNMYNNFASCSWLIHVPAPATGMRLSLPLLATEAADLVSISSGSDGSDVASFNPVAQVSGIYAQGTTAFVLNTTWALVVFTSDISHPSNPWNAYVGARVRYQGTGCPAGHRLVAGVSIGPSESNPLATSNVWQCVPCEAGSFSSVPDSMACLPCDAGSFAPTQGMDSCSPVSRGYFQSSPGSTVQLSCADAGWPEDCETSPYMHGSSGVAAIFFVVLTLVAMILLAGTILVFRTQRVLFHASPQFLLGITAGLILFSVGLLLHALPQTAALCNAKLFLLYPAPSLMLGSLLARSYRLHRIFNNKLLQTVKLAVWKLWAGIGAVVMVDIVLLAVLVDVAPYEVPLSDFPECTASGPESLRLLISLLVIKALLLLAVVAVSIALRSIPSSYNESKIMSGAMGNIALVGLIMLVFTYSPIGVNSSTGSQTSLQIALGIYAVLSTAGILFGQKLAGLYKALFTGSNKLAWEQGGGDGNTTQIGQTQMGTLNKSALPANDENGVSTMGSPAPITRSILPAKPVPTAKVTSVATLRAAPLKAHALGASPAKQPSSSPSSARPSLTPTAAWSEPADAAIAGSANPLASSSAGAASTPQLPNAVEELDGAGATEPPRAASPTGELSVRITPPQGPASSLPSPPLATRTASTASPKDAAAPSSLRSRWQSARAEVQSLQSAVNRSRADLEKQERRLALLNNKVMTLAFEMEAEGQ